VVSTTMSLLIKAKNISIIYMETVCLQRVTAEMGHRQTMHNIQIRWEELLHCTLFTFNEISFYSYAFYVAG
jgi:hypothetical protein